MHDSAGFELLRGSETTTAESGSAGGLAGERSMKVVDVAPLAVGVGTGLLFVLGLAAAVAVLTGGAVGSSIAFGIDAGVALVAVGGVVRWRGRRSA